MAVKFTGAVEFPTQLPSLDLRLPVSASSGSAAISPVAGTVGWTGKRGRPLASRAHLTLAATQPWLALGMSRRTWFRRRAKGLISETLAP